MKNYFVLSAAVRILKLLDCSLTVADFDAASVVEIAVA